MYGLESGLQLGLRFYLKFWLGWGILLYRAPRLKLKNLISEGIQPLLSEHVVYIDNHVKLW